MYGAKCKHSCNLWFIFSSFPLVAAYGHKKPCHKRPEPNVAGYKVVVDSFFGNEEVSMLDNEMGGVKLLPLCGCYMSYCVISLISG